MLKFQSSFLTFSLPRFLLGPESSKRFFLFSISLERNILEITSVFSPGDRSFFSSCLFDATTHDAVPAIRSADPMRRRRSLEKNDPTSRHIRHTAGFLSLSLVVPPDTQPALFLHRSLFLFLFLRCEIYLGILICPGTGA